MIKTVESLLLKIPLLLILTFTACSNQLSEGEIISKRYEPERTFVMLVPMIYSCGNNCTSTMMIPYWVHDDEDYVITVSGYDKSGHQLTEEWFVDKQTYEAAETGRRNVFSSSYASRDDQHKKLRKAES